MISRRALVPVLVALAAGGATPSAEAALGVTIDAGGAVTVTGTDGAEKPTFEYDNTGFTVIRDATGFTGPAPALCTSTDPKTGMANANVLSCQDNNARTLNSLTVNLLGGNDVPDLQECFAAIAVNLGDGQNSLLVPACETGAITVTAGKDQDTVNSPVASKMTITASLGDGNDTFFGGSGAATVHGDGGDDYLVGSSAGDKLYGDIGNDQMLGKAGSDLLDGGDGDDLFSRSKGVSDDDDLGADEYRGGIGKDELTFDNHPTGVTVTLDDLPNDGSLNEGDNVHADIERVIGSTKDDTLTGSAAADYFDAAAGKDTVHGGAGNDEIFGGSDGDLVFGDAGDDTVYGDYGDDTVDGGPGRDSMYGDLGNCSSAGCPAYADKLLARDGEVDSVQCGAGADTVEADGTDVVAQDGFQACESVDRGAIAAPTVSPSPAPTAAPSPPALKVSADAGRSAKIASGLPVKVTCTAGCTFTAKLRLSKKNARKKGLGSKTTIGTVKGALLEAGSTRVTVKLSARARRKLKKRIGAKLQITATDADGKTSVATKTVTLKP